MHAADIPALAERASSHYICLVSQQIGSGNETRADAPRTFQPKWWIQPSASVPEDQEVSAMRNKHSLNLRVKTRDRAAIRFVPFIVDRYYAHKDSGIFIGHEANWAWFFLHRHTCMHLSYARDDVRIILWV